MGYIVGMLASHIRSADQVAELRHCLASVVAQSVTPQLFLISYSATARTRPHAPRTMTSHVTSKA